MKGRLFVLATASFFLCMFLVVLALSASIAVKAPTEGASTSVTSLPASLDKLYPPNAQSPVLLQAMHGLNAALMGIVVDITENDREGAVANLENFKKEYRENALLVPEWESWYPAAPVEELGKVVPNGAPGEIMAAVSQVGDVCHKCHLTTMVAVQHKYRWPDFGAITVHDPVIDKDLDYPGFMQMLNTSLCGVAIDLGQGQLENALTHVSALRSRMAELKESCDACHDTERAYFVDGRIDSLLAEMGRTLDATSIDPTAVAILSQRIGEESCSRCHLVHLPGAYSQFAR